jgi:hypothetical protein
MDFDKIKVAIGESLGLDSWFVVDFLTPIVKLGDGDVEGIDVADILFKVGAYDTNHLSDGHINEEGRKFLRKIGERYASYSGRFNSLAKETSSDILRKLTPNDIRLIAEYKGAAA